MRTTVEISEVQRRALSSIAQKRGLRGFSVIVQEAVDAYLRDLGSEQTDALLGLEGMLDDEQEREVRSRIDAARAQWRAP